MTPSTQPSEAVPSYLGAAVLLTLFCNLLGGAVALWFSHRVRAAVRAGDLEAARKASSQTRLALVGTVVLGFALFGGGWLLRGLFGLTTGL